MKKWVALSFGLAAVLVAILLLRSSAPPAPSDAPVEASAPSASATSAPASSNEPTAATEASDAGAQLHTLRIRISDSDGPADGATVLLDGKPQPALADSKGLWSAALAEAPHQVGARRGTESAAPVKLDGFPKGNVVLTLRDSVQVTGNVVSQADGSAIPGATVKLGADQTTTDADGAFSFAAPPGQLDLRVSKGGFISLERAVNVGTDALQLRLALVASVSISGVVVDASGNPIPGAHVKCWGHDHPDTKKVTADEKGAFSFDGLSAFEYNILARADGFGAAQSMLVAPASGVRMLLHRGGEIEGTVFDGEGKPCPGARVQLSAAVELASDPPPTITDKNGHYDATGVAAGPEKIWAERDGEVPSKMQTITVVDQGYQKIDLHLGGGGGGRTVRGVVLDAKTHAPIAKVDVSCDFGPNRKPGERAPDDFTTGPDGTFVFRHVPDDVQFIETEVDGYGDGKLAPADSLTFNLVPTSMLRGRVLDAQGAPLHDFDVNGNDVTSADGHFSVPMPDAGPVEVNKYGYLSQSVPLPDHPAGAGADLGDVTLKKAGDVTVTVLDPDGAPDPGAQVYLWNANRPSYRKQIADDQMPLLGMTDANGVARFTLAPASTCFIPFDARFATCTPDSCPHVVTDQGGAFTVQFAKAAWVHGHVSENGQPAAGWFVGSMDEDMVTLTDAQGAFRLGPFCGGKQRIVYGDGDTNAQEIALSSKSVTLSTGQDLELDLGEEGTTIAIDVISQRAAGAVVVGACPGTAIDTKSDLPPGCQIRFTALSGGKAEITLQGIQPGANVIFAGYPDQSTKDTRKVPFTATPGAANAVTIDLGP